MTREITYRGWEIDRYQKPDCCFYAYAPSYDGLTESDTQRAPTLHELCEDINEEISRREAAAESMTGYSKDKAVQVDRAWCFLKERNGMANGRTSITKLDLSAAMNLKSEKSA